MKDDWLKRAKAIETLEEFGGFIKELTDHEHDYGTFVHASQAAMMAGRYAFKGMTGAQAGFLGWGLLGEFISLGNNGARLIKYEDMLYPQNEVKFAKTISRGTWRGLQDTALKNLSDKANGHPDVRAHWQTIVDGVIPFGHTVRDDE